MRWAYLFLRIPIGKYLFFTSKNAISDKKASETARGLWRHWLESASIKMASSALFPNHYKDKEFGTKDDESQSESEGPDGLFISII